MILFNYQVPAVEFILKNKRVLLDLPAGSGKTIIAGEAMRRADAFPALIVTPSSVKRQFASELEKHFGITDIQVVDSSTKTLDKSKKVFIINPDILKKKYEVLKSIPWKMVVGDESHYYKTHNVIRTKALAGITEGVEYVVLMSGTPMPLGIIDLYSQYSVLKPEVFGARTKKYPNRVFDWFGFAQRYCDGHFGRFGFEYKGATNIDELRERSTNIRFALKEEEVLKDLPELQIIDTLFSMDKKDKAGYDEINKDFENYLRSIGKTEYEVYKSMTNEALVKLNELRKYTSMVKLKHLKEMVENMDDKVILFFAYTASVDYFKGVFGDEARTVIGRDSETQRTENINSWKLNPNVKYLLVNIKAGGAGLNLQEARFVVFAELPWSWADFRQCYARAWRKGQNRRVLVYKPMVEGTVDEKINKIIYDKKAQTELV